MLLKVSKIILSFLKLRLIFLIYAVLFKIHLFSDHGAEANKYLNNKMLRKNRGLLIMFTVFFD